MHTYTTRVYGGWKVGSVKSPSQQIVLHEWCRVSSYIADSEIAIHMVLIATLQSSLTLHFYGTHIYTLTVKVNSICCIQNPLQGLNTKRRRGAKLQICWKILYLRGQQGCVWHLCLGIPKSQGCEEMKFQSKCKIVLYIEGLTIF